MARNRGRERGGLDAWPGYVDALSTLLMVIIFVLLVFILAQGFLSVVLSNRDRALDRLNRQVAELAEMLSLERGQAEELRNSLNRLAEELGTASSARDLAIRQLGQLREERNAIAGERDAARSERERLTARIADLELAARGGAERIATLERQLAEALTRAESVGGDVARTVRDLTEARRVITGERNAREALARERAALEQQVRATQEQLAQVQRDLEAVRREAATLDRQVQADRATIEARLSDIARMNEQIRALNALREELERQAQAALARAQEEERRRRGAETESQRAAREAAEAAAARAAAEAAMADAQRRARQAEESAAASAGNADERVRRAQEQAQEYGRLAESARAQVALLTQQLTALRAEIQRLASALEVAEEQGRDREAQIALLGQRLNAALAARVEELQRYRSDFFGRLRQVLGDRPEVRIVGDRFVFQSEVLFPAASAELTPAGEQQIRDLAQVLLEISRQIPEDIPWVLRVDGHADRNPIRSSRFASNWELAAARAIAVARLLIAEGLPANRVAAASFGDTQPLDQGDSPAALARNRRIELRLTDR